MLKLNRLEGRALYRFMSACCASSFMLFGYDAGVLGGIQTTPQFHHSIGNPQGSFVIPIIASVYNLAGGVMALCVAFFGMQIGRKNTLQLGNLLLFIGAVLQASSFSVAQIIVARIIAGAGIGCVAASVPTYMAEMSLEAKERGPEVSYQLAILVTGVALAYWIDLGFTQGLDDNPNLWRAPLALQVCFLIFSGTGLCFLPDTPRWLYYRGRLEEGDRVLARLHASSVDDPTVQFVRREILSSIEEESGAKFNPLILFWDNTDLRIGRRLRIAFLLMFVQQFLGINMLVYYSTSIYLSIGFSELNASILAAAMNTVFAIACYPPIWMIERVGRRRLMFWGCFGCGICMIAFVMLSLTPRKQTQATQAAEVAVIFVYVICLAVGWEGPAWIYGPEIAPLKYRHIAGALAGCGEWLSTFIIVFGGGTGLTAVGPIIFIWPLICCFLGMVFVYVYCPETAGLTLEEIDVLFAKPEKKAELEAATLRNREAAGTLRETCSEDSKEPDTLYVEEKV